MSTDVPRALLAAATATGGLVLLSRPGPVARASAGAGAVPPRGIVRVLGARYLAQGCAQLVVPNRGVLVVSAGGDGVHLLTMIAAAISWPGYRRAAAISGALAAVSALAAGVLSRPRG